MCTGFLLFSHADPPVFITAYSWALPNTRAPGGTRTLTVAHLVLNQARLPNFATRAYDGVITKTVQLTP